MVEPAALVPGPNRELFCIQPWSRRPGTCVVWRPDASVPFEDPISAERLLNRRSLRMLSCTKLLAPKEMLQRMHIGAQRG